MGEYDDAVHADCLHEEGGGVGGGGEGDGWAVGRELSSALWKVVAPVERACTVTCKSINKQTPYHRGVETEHRFNCFPTEHPEIAFKE